MTAVLVITLLLAALTALPAWRNPAWWVRVADFARLQLAVLLLGTSLLTILLVPMTTMFWGLLAVQASCLLYLAWWIVPYTRLFPVEVKTARPDDHGRRLRIMTANVLTSNRNAACLIGLVETHRPDIVVTLESDTWWQNQLAPLERCCRRQSSAASHKKQKRRRSRRHPQT